MRRNGNKRSTENPFAKKLIVAAAARVLLAGSLASVLAYAQVQEWPAQQCPDQSLNGKSALDASTRCLACHEGVLAPQVIPNLGDTDGYSRSGNHPINVSYLEAYQRNPESFVAPAQVDPRIHMENGQVECSSCHAGSSREPTQLVMPNYRDELCKSCHR